jgi:glycine cleavage system H lipoate-binding protein
MTSRQYRDNYGRIKWARQAPTSRVDTGQSSRTFVVMKDIEPFVSPVDGKVVGSRSALREHERRHNVRQIGNDWAGSERPANWDEIRHG